MASSRRFARLVLTAAVLSGALALSACVGQSSFAQLDSVQPAGSPFSQALFKDYAYLARSFGNEAGTSGTAFDADNSLALNSYTSDVTDLANAFADKAIVAGRGEEVVVEPAPEGDNAAQEVRLHALKDIDAGRDKAPDAAARVQADYDCWILNGRIESLKSSSAQCRRSLDASMAAVERALNMTEAPAPDAAAPAPAPAAQAADYTVYFDWDSWTLTAEDMAAIQQSVDAARHGQQSRITIVGHTDTSGSARFNQRLSERRASVVRDVMVQMGARPESIQTSGVGESDLAVQTANGVKEAKNRRAVITLLP
jgi:OmpA-OmpF porin, OOP family